MKDFGINLGSPLDINVIHMPTTMCSQATQDQDTASADLETRLTEMEEKLRKVTVAMENLRWENENLKYWNAKLNKTTMLSQSEQQEGEAQSAGGTNGEELEKRRLHNELCILVNKYERWPRRMGDFPKSSSCSTTQTCLIEWK